MDENLIKFVSARISFYIENCESISLETFIKNLINDIISVLDLQDYVRCVNFLEVYDKNPSSRGVVDKEGNVCIFREGIKKNLEEVLEDIPNLSDLEVNMCICLLYVKTILHELEHIKQQKLLIVDKENKSIETLITRLCESQKEKNDFIYRACYDYYPTERLAELNALRTMTKVIDHLKEKFDIEMLACYLKKEAIREEFHEYIGTEFDGPTKDFFKNWFEEGYIILEKEIDIKKIKLEDRLLYGLNISQEECIDMLKRFGELEERLGELSSEGKKQII